MSTKEERVAWFRESRFGMFIHWGVYSILGQAEWVMHNQEIPKEEYRKLLSEFNPTRFDADAWAELAFDAGMRYMVITAKHHDGFAMFKSHCTDYNIVDATPFGRDPIAELAEACARRGIRLGFYYSHVQDWYEHRVGWDYPALGRAGKPWNVITDEEATEFDRYLRRKVYPQIEELLTQYGPVGLLWFDTPLFFSEAQARELASFIRGLQPDCLINGRLLNKQYYPMRIEDIDYEGMGDNEVPPLPTGIDWEAPMTTHNGWGFRKPEETVWTDADVLLSHLIRMASAGGNYLLNVGPSPLGEIPDPAAERLRSIGGWLEANGESIYGTRGNPFGHDLEFGTATTKDNFVFLHVTEPVGRAITVNGLENEIESVELLAGGGASLGFRREHADDIGRLTIELPDPLPDDRDTVVVVQTKGKVRIARPVAQRPDGRVALAGPLATIHRADPQSTTQVEANGVIGSWFDPQDYAEWSFRLLDPGTYAVEVVQRADFWGKHKWDTGHEIEIQVGKNSVEAILGEDGEIEGRGGHLTKRVRVGQVTLREKGRYKLTVRPRKIAAEHHWGLRIQEVDLKPV